MGILRTKYDRTYKFNVKTSEKNISLKDLNISNFVCFTFNIINTADLCCFFTKRKSINVVTAIGGGGQGFCDVSK